jgi:hypothetical protein
MILLYVFISYMIMLGMIFDSHSKNSDVPLSTWMVWLFSPIVLPIILGMILNEKSKDNE